MGWWEWWWEWWWGGVVGGGMGGVGRLLTIHGEGHGSVHTAHGVGDVAGIVAHVIVVKGCQL